MAWLFQHSFEPQYQKGIELTPEMKPIQEADKQAFFVDVLEERMTFRPSYHDGFRYPKPSTVYDLDCAYEAGIFAILCSRVLRSLIPQRVIDVIEDIEPGVHQYFPVRLILRSGEPEPEPYFILNVCTLIEVLDKEWSQVNVFHLPEERHEARPWNKVSILLNSGANQIDPPYDLFVPKDKIRGRALWCEYGMKSAGSPFFSDECVDRINEIGGMEGYEPFKRVEEI